MITYNALRCKNCNDTIESTFRHDFKYCSCGDCFVDGGKDYIRHGCPSTKTPEESFQDLSQIACKASQSLAGS